MQTSSRVMKELKRLVEHPPEGIIYHLTEERTNILTIHMIGPHNTPYEGALFELEVEIPRKYPFLPPRIQFVTPIYHPNIDGQGRICLDLLKMPPNGGWRPTITLESLLVAVLSLLGNPNPDDPLMVDIADEFRFNKATFEMKAKKLARQHAKQNDC
ncbi:ubiquitin-conjugating enzyme E2 T-like [Copidosoma floridanum]|uniref:ubiquitin-conjugating enzyme E2 T n=1 Tax=Copidosoma floridanum TaxID=29053 RepID=UPI0006C94E5E|nr:ubiquitin-conjugating enzyme E2 T [Copidosoma floridanum]XP_014217288.1 ubiquitin-conjugating enzyme E2 T-like [Copidosoma floridanum]